MAAINKDKYKKLADGLYTDRLGCYDDKGNCFCAECFYYGYNSVNCGYVCSDEEYDKLETVVWDKDKGFIKA
jgi:hypothetical protein